MGLLDNLYGDDFWAKQQQKVNQQKSDDRYLDGLLAYERWKNPPVMNDITPLPDMGLDLATLADAMNPINGIFDAMRSSQRMLAPDTSGWDRVAAGGQMAGDIAGAALDFLPAGFLGGRAATGAARLAEDALTPLDTSTYRLGQDMMPPVPPATIAGRPAQVAIPGTGTVAARPISDIENTTRDYLAKRGLLDVRPPSPAFNEDRAGLIAAEYDMMKNAPQDPNVARSYDAMISETLDQYKALRDAGVDIKFLQPGMTDPYAASPAQGYRDLVENGRLWVYPTDFGFGSNAAFDPRENPLLKGVGRVGDKDNAVANDAFRAVHDIFGHFGPGNPFFRHKGEERAWLEHSRMYSPEARGAMTSETRGQNSWLNFGPYAEKNRTASGADTVFADQKAGLMDPWTYDPNGMPDPDRERMLREWWRR